MLQDGLVSNTGTLTAVVVIRVNSELSCFFLFQSKYGDMNSIATDFCCTYICKSYVLSLDYRAINSLFGIVESIKMQKNDTNGIENVHNVDLSLLT